MKKKFLSILLSVMMVLSIAASSGVTFAAEYNDEGKISLANATILPCQTITATAVVTLSTEIQVQCGTVQKIQIRLKN